MLEDSGVVDAVVLGEIVDAPCVVLSLVSRSGRVLGAAGAPMDAAIEPLAWSTDADTGAAIAGVEVCERGGAR
jgi:hypothetical protein